MFSLRIVGEVRNVVWFVVSNLNLDLAVQIRGFSTCYTWFFPYVRALLLKHVVGIQLWRRCDCVLWVFGG